MDKDITIYPNVGHVLEDMGYGESTMDSVYHDGSGHLMCSKCGFCLPCGDCKKHGCGWLTAQKEGV